MLWAGVCVGGWIGRVGVRRGIERTTGAAPSALGLQQDYVLLGSAEVGRWAAAFVCLCVYVPVCAHVFTHACARHACLTLRSCVALLGDSWMGLTVVGWMPLHMPLHNLGLFLVLTAGCSLRLWLLCPTLSQFQSLIAFPCWGGPVH